MKDRKHTPLPWNVVTDAPEYPLCIGFDVGLVGQIGECDDPDAQDHANAEFITLACNSHYKLVEVAEMAGNIAHNLLEDIGGIAGGPVMSGLRKLLAHCNAAIADATKPEQEKPHDASNN